MTQRRAFTLVETLVAIVVGTLLFLGTLRMFTSGMSSSQKGAGHLTNMGAAAVLLAQLEDDFQQAVKINGPARGETAENASVDIVNPENGGTTTIVYQATPGAGGGYQREIGGGSGGSHTFCRGLGVECKIARVEVPAGSGREGVWVVLRTWTLPHRTEETRLQRFIACPNLDENRKAAQPGFTF